MRSDAGQVRDPPAARPELGPSGHVPRPETEFLSGGSACYRPYRTRDGRDVARGAIEPRFWSAFCWASGRPDWLPRLDEALPQLALISELDAHLGALALAECEALYEGLDCCLSVVLDLKQAVDSEHLRARSLVRHHPEMKIYEAAFPVRIDGRAPALRRALVEDGSTGPAWSGASREARPGSGA